MHRQPTSLPVKDRIRNNVLVESDTGCWIWAGKKNRQDYASITIGGKTVAAHRASYEAFVGFIPAGLVIDHLCRTPACVNPEHLEPVTQWENVVRGTGYRFNARKTHCLLGHELHGENVYLYKQFRQCRKCNRATATRSKAVTRLARVTQKQIDMLRSFVEDGEATDVADFDNATNLAWRNRERVLVALRRRKLLTDDNAITEAGREILTKGVIPWR